MKIKIRFIVIIIAFLYHSGSFSQSKVEFIPTSINSPTDFITFKNRLFFTGIELGQSWRPYISDGTTAGTKLLKNITILNNNNSFYGFTHWTISGDKMFFIAKDTINGNELWVTDGTENGTRLVKNISPRDTSTSIVKIHSLSNGKVYFYLSPHNQPLKVQLWVSDGTDAGTYSFFEASTISINIDVFNNQMYYYIYEGLWVTDGTTNGSRLVKNLKEPNTEVGGIFNPFVATSQKFFFSTYASNGYRLWVSDGTTQGTFILDTLLTASGYMIPMGNKILLSGSTGSGNSYAQGIWVSDGTVAGTKLLKNIAGIRNMTALNNKVIFAAIDSLSGNWALWTSDGTTTGTFMVKNDFSISEINPRIVDETIPSGAPFYTLKNKAYFFANRTRFTTGELYETDGTSRGTDTLRSFPDHRILRFDRSNAVVLNDKLYLGLKEEISLSGGIGVYQNGLHVISNPISRIENTEGVTDIKIYPTLTNDRLYIESPTFSITRIRIVDLLGHLVVEQKNYSKKMDISLNNLMKNIYFIQIETENGTITRKFLKI